MKLLLLEQMARKALSLKYRISLSYLFTECFYVLLKIYLGFQLAV